MEIQTLYSDDIKKQDLTLFINLIYNNFIELSEEQKLMHTKEDIEKNLRADNSVIILVLDKKINKMLVFLTANIIELDDRRLVFYISYVYTAEKYRNNGIASRIFDVAEQIAHNKKCNGIMLIFDTENKQLYHFYEGKGYMQDINLRRYEQHDVFYKII
jgi:ribosomal protein S18 acetylase RimI-like enzyme